MRRLVLVLVVLLVAAACGGGGVALDSTVADGESGAVVDLDSDFVRATRLLVDRWGGREAFFAVAASLDLGYSAGQIVAGADKLLFDGSINGLAPAGSPEGLLSPEGPGGEGPPSAAGGSVGVFAAPRRIPLYLAQSGIPADSIRADHRRLVERGLAGVAS